MTKRFLAHTPVWNKVMSSESQSRKANKPPPAHQCGEDAGDLVLAALGVVRGFTMIGWDFTLYSGQASHRVSASCAGK